MEDAVCLVSIESRLKISSQAILVMSSSIKVEGIAYLVPGTMPASRKSGLPAKSTKAVFTETDEIIYVLRGDKLYSINLYPYGISSDPTVKLMLDSFTFTY